MRVTTLDWTPVQRGTRPLVAALLCVCLTLMLPFGARVVCGQTVRVVDVLRAEDRRAPAPEDLATIRSGLRSGDPQTVRVAVRALGRLERAGLIRDMLPLLRHPSPEVRAEAATAVGQAAQGWKREAAAESSGTLGSKGTLDSAQAALIGRLRVEANPGVRAALADTLGRLPYVRAQQVKIVERALLHAARPGQSARPRRSAPPGRSARPPAAADEQLGVAQGLLRLARVRPVIQPLSAAARSMLIELMASAPSASARSASAGFASAPSSSEPSSDTASAAASAATALQARVRRVALEAYLALGPPERAPIEAALRDPDAQLRRLAVRGAAALPDRAGGALVKTAAGDESPIVRIEALRGLLASGADAPCDVLLNALRDPSTQVALIAIDQLSHCGASADAVSALTQAAAAAAASASASASVSVSESGQASPDSGSRREWHRAAHALVSLATAAPERAAAALGQFIGSPIWQLRMYAAHAAETLKNRDALETLARDRDDNVREVAIDALAKLYGHDADTIFVEQLTRTGHQVLRSAALALAGTPHVDLANGPLQSVLQRLTAEGIDNSHDAREAIRKALDSLNPHPTASDGTAAANQAAAPPRVARVEPDLNAATLRRLKFARARVTMRGLGTFELALLTDEAPASVVRFVRLAEAGYYNGLTFHRVVPNFVIQGGSPGANEYIGDAAFMRDEVGLLPHVRGAVGVSTRGRDTGDAQIFIDLVDNPRLDHDYTVFAQVNRGMDVVDRILEGDVIERVEIETGIAP